MTTTADLPRDSGTWTTWHGEDQPIRIGISSCLLGENVRYDGGHCRDRFLAGTLGEWVEWVSVCPEMEIGLGKPRPTIRLVENESGETRLVAPASGYDHTDTMRAWSRARIRQLAELDLDGYVLKRSSPSCGMERLPVYRGRMKAHKNGVGVFAQELMEAWPLLPVEEEGRLNDPLLRENFIERIFCRNRWRNLVEGGLSRRRLVEFHTAHKLLLRTHDEVGHGELGRLVGSAGQVSDEELFASYEHAFQACLQNKSSVKGHTNVLQHAMGYFKELLDARDRAELAATIEEYRLGRVPLIVPLTLIRFNIRKYDVEYLAGQLYFDPHPRELMLRNHC